MEAKTVHPFSLDSVKLPVSEVDWSFLDAEHKMFEEVNRKQNARLEYLLRNKVVPPIKGEITKGKIKHRGLTISYLNDLSHGIIRSTLLQRGKVIDPIQETQIIIEFK